MNHQTRRSRRQKFNGIKSSSPPSSMPQPSVHVTASPLSCAFVEPTFMPATSLFSLNEEHSCSVSSLPTNYDDANVNEH